MAKEITEVVDLAHGRRLNRAAVGWTRTPLHYLADVAGTLILIAILAAMVMVRYF